MNDVLVLDINWQPVATTTYENAVKLWYEDVATIVEEDAAGRKLHSPSFEMKMPRVIRVKNAWSRLRKKSVPCSRRNIFLRDNGRCQYCGQQVTTYNYQIEHVVPECQGGRSAWQNLVLSCGPCNAYKGGRTPEQAGMKLLRQPFVPKSSDMKYTFRLDLRKARVEWTPYLYYNMPIDEGV